MNVYDFDKTIYDGDSTVDFIFWCFFHHPLTLLYLPNIAFCSVRFYLLHIGTKTQFKEQMYRFLKACDTENDVHRFWQQHRRKIKRFYLDRRRNDDVVISASPEFLLKPLEKMMDINVIASRVSPRDGKYDGLNCYHTEKVRRFYEAFENGKIDHFFSDSYADEPLAAEAEAAYLVSGENISDWDFTKHKKHLRI